MTATETVSSGRPQTRRASRSERRLLTPEGVPLIFQLAERGERAAAVLIDLVIMIVTLVVAVLGLLFVFSWFDLGGLAFGLTILVFFFLRFFYFTYFELRWQGQTPGKRALGIRVIDRRGGYLRPDAVFSRNLLREVELFLPLTLLMGVQFTVSETLVNLLTLGWVAIFLLLPFFNKDRLRAGDIVAGTWVVAAPKAVLLKDVAEEAARPSGSAPGSTRGGAAVVQDPEFPFTRGQLEIYGIYELQTLEEVLRQKGPQAGETRLEVARRIQRKIDWEGGENVDPERFLKAFYTALRAHLETRMLFGERREDKHAGKTPPNSSGTEKT